jgi:hypothetical protein
MFFFQTLPRFSLADYFCIGILSLPPRHGEIPMWDETSFHVFRCYFYLLFGKFSVIYTFPLVCYLVLFTFLRPSCSLFQESLFTLWRFLFTSLCIFFSILICVLTIRRAFPILDYSTLFIHPLLMN